MSEQSKYAAVVKTLQMWNWLADHGFDGKSAAIKALNLEDELVDYPSNECYLCGEIKGNSGRCEGACPMYGKWWSLKYDPNDLGCMKNDSTFQAWWDCEGSTYDKNFFALLMYENVRDEALNG